jgi:hypothetical protein
MLTGYYTLKEGLKVKRTCGPRTPIARDTTVKGSPMLRDQGLRVLPMAKGTEVKNISPCTEASRLLKK